MSKAKAIEGDPLVTLGMARVMMHKRRKLPRAPLKIIDEVCWRMRLGQFFL